MKRGVNNLEILSQFSPHIFWNCNIENYDLYKDKRNIIERIVEFGNEKDEVLMWKLFKYSDIKRYTLNMEYLDNAKIRYMAFVLKVTKEKFKSYKKESYYSTEEECLSY